MTSDEIACCSASLEEGKKANREASYPSLKSSLSTERRLDEPQVRLLPEWSAVCCCAPPKPPHIIRPFARLCSRLGILPKDLVIAGLQLIEGHLRCKNPHRYALRFRTDFNEVIRLHPQLGLREIPLPPRKPRREHPRVAAERAGVCPELIAELRNHWLPHKAAGTLKAHVADKRDADILRGLCDLAKSGYPVVGLKTITDLMAEEVLNAYLAASSLRGRPSGRKRVDALLHLAARGVRQYPLAIKALTSYRETLSQDNTIAPNNLAWVLRNLPPERIRFRYAKAQEMLESAVACRNPIRKLSEASAAMALLILLVAPVTSKELAAINADEDMTYHPTRANALQLRIVDRDTGVTKERIVITGSVVPHLQRGKLILAQTFTRRSSGGWLFPVFDGTKPQSPKNMVTGLTKQFKKFGIDATPENFRDLLAGVILEQFPDATESVAQALGYSRANVAAARYAPLIRTFRRHAEHSRRQANSRKS